MKARLTEQYDLTLTKREMGELMLALRVFVRDFDASPLAEEVLDSLEEVYQGGGHGLPIERTPVKFDDLLVADEDDPDDDEGGSPVAAE
jgi:hypothetical protein